MPDFTAKHFEVIANVLANERKQILDSAPSTSLTLTVSVATWSLITESLMETFEADNPRFDRVRFWKACHA